MNEHIFWFIFFKNYIDDIKDIYKLQLKKEIEYNSITYNLNKNVSLPNLIINNKSKNDFKINDSFAYKEINSNSSDIYFGLDSEPEKYFVDELISYIKNNSNNIKVWTKNSKYDGVNFQYINSDYEIANSFPDFLIKNNEHFIYIEVKKYKNDNNYEKTESIYEGYKKYILNNKNNTFKLTLCVCLC
ncbi:hypothetical protein NWQ33_01900 [Mycoplasmopsis cynos]|nr:hypothetical protein [Mycoplasmopsis cynos]